MALSLPREAIFVFEAMTTPAAIVLAAGHGVRMRSQTPKVLHPICGREMVALVVDAAREANLTPLVAVVQADSQAVRETLGDRVRYSEQPEPLGSADALLRARTEANGSETIVVLCGDVPLVRSPTLRRMINVHDESRAFVTLLTASHPKPEGLGRVVRGESGQIQAIVEDREADDATLAIDEVNGGVYCFQADWLWDQLDRVRPSRNGELYLTDVVGMAFSQGKRIESVEPEDIGEVLGVNTRVHLAAAETALRDRIRERWMLAGVTIPDPSSVFIDADAELRQDAILLPNTHITGKSVVGRGCRIGPNSVVSESRIGDDCTILASYVEGATLDEGVHIGPFSHIRPASRLGNGVHIGSFAEVKNSRLGPGTRSHHFSYIGDADLGANVNVGAGTVTCNYDGNKKSKTTIGDDSFIGSDTMLVAPLSIGRRSSTGAGSVVTKDVPPDSVAVGAPARILPKKGRDRPRGGPTPLATTDNNS